MPTGAPQGSKLLVDRRWCAAHNVSVQPSQGTQAYLSGLTGAGDSLDTAVEELVRAPKVAVETDPRGLGLRAPNRFVLRVKVALHHSVQLKVVATKAGGQWYLSLVTERGKVLRQYHKQYGPHRNPDQTPVPPLHKHFPTKRYPLREGHKDMDTWAYDPGEYPAEFVGGVKEFCKECNVEIEALQERLNLRWLQ